MAVEDGESSTVMAGFTATEVEADDVQPEPLVTVTLYEPAAAVVTELIAALAPETEKPFGPVHKKLFGRMDDDVVAESVNVVPSQTALLLLAVTVKASGSEIVT